MEEIKVVILNKNRGWRGLAELECVDNDDNVIHKMIFSFSQPVWDNLMYMTPAKIVVQDETFYYVLEINEGDRAKLPVGHQRSVLIKNWIGKVEQITKVPKTSWTSETGTTWSAINNFIKNRNNHTTSDWNCIGVRVTPAI